MHCGKVLMLLRKFKNKSQTYVAEKMNKTQQWISQLEKRKHLNGKELDNILKALNSTCEEWNKFKRGLFPLKIEIKID